MFLSPIWTVRKAHSNSSTADDWLSVNTISNTVNKLSSSLRNVLSSVGRSRYCIYSHIFENRTTKTTTFLGFIFRLSPCKLRGQLNIYCARQWAVTRKSPSTLNIMQYERLKKKEVEQNIHNDCRILFQVVEYAIWCVDNISRENQMWNILTVSRKKILISGSKRNWSWSSQENEMKIMSRRWFLMESYALQIDFGFCQHFTSIRNWYKLKFHDGNGYFLWKKPDVIWSRIYLHIPLETGTMNFLNGAIDAKSFYPWLFILSNN